MKRYAYSLLELIFIIVIIGILTGIAFYGFRPDYLRNDVAKVVMELENTRYQGVGYDKTGLSTGGSIGCIDLNDLDKNTTGLGGTKDYKFHSKVEVEVPSSLEVACFDTFGRVFDGKKDNNLTDLTGNGYLKVDVKISLQYGGKTRYIIIDHLSGFIRVKR